MPKLKKQSVAQRAKSQRKCVQKLREDEQFVLKEIKIQKGRRNDTRSKQLDLIRKSNVRKNSLYKSKEAETQKIRRQNPLNKSLDRIRKSNSRQSPLVKSKEAEIQKNSQTIFKK